MNRTVALMFAVAVVAAGVLAAGSSGAGQARRTIGLILEGPGNPIAPEVIHGGRSAAAALGDTLAVTVTDDATGTIDSLIAKHAAVIADDNEQDNPLVSQALEQARRAGIPTLSFEQSYPGTVWVSQSSPVQYADALADALASQMERRGQYLIVPCQPAEDVVQTWLDETKAYVGRRYPDMHLAGVVYGSTGNGDAGTIVLKPVLRAHPQVRGLDFLCPSESYTGPPQLIKDHVVGKVFSAGNGSDCPPLYSAYAWNVRRGAEEIVCSGDPTNLGYLTVWAADYLARGHKLSPGSVKVGGPVGTVRYFRQNEELRLGQPVTITRANLARYVAK
jgi:ABC-type sugar transport system substrate-binding protein